MVRNRTNIPNKMAMKWVATTQEKVFTILATINDIDDTFGWSYIACHKCMKKLNKRGDQYMCPTCNEPAKYPTPRFKIQLEVSDETAAAKLTLFDRDAQQLLHTTASELLQHGSNKEIPTVLRNLCKQTLIFEIKLSDHNLKKGSQNYTVTRTFIPTSLIEEQSTHKSVQKDPISPQQISSDEEEEPLVFKKKKKQEASKPRQSVSNHQEENNGQDDITSTDEEQILIQTLRTPTSKRTRDGNGSTTRKRKRITRQIK
ncbi:uncharacterized protein LOC130712013 [Lotus japonicus]|uniref:uncharacterized protein LOC130712013 n=1 Tax=Lotus japonicus TaxID=34305 RepID=UPI002588EA79|nr:uncharacterized protein LOC130712013 [Lotus japonicus]